MKIKSCSNMECKYNAYKNRCIYQGNIIIDNEGVCTTAKYRCGICGGYKCVCEEK